jgi:ElaB/YqjD/DUF883 family membrane-anchored ribosome-binding protein
MTTQSTAKLDTNFQSAHKISTDGHSLMETIQAAGPEVGAQVRQIVEAGSARVTELKGGLVDSIREKPIKSALIAAGVGAVIGLFFGRRPR